MEKWILIEKIWNQCSEVDFGCKLGLKSGYRLGKVDFERKIRKNGLWVEKWNFSEKLEKPYFELKIRKNGF